LTDIFVLNAYFNYDLSLFWPLNEFEVKIYILYICIKI